MTQSKVRRICHDLPFDPTACANAKMTFNTFVNEFFASPSTDPSTSTASTDSADHDVVIGGKSELGDLTLTPALLTGAFSPSLLPSLPQISTPSSARSSAK